jgi:uncharacterized SAM-binding protein YcdF (DUF218 family)
MSTNARPASDKSEKRTWFVSLQTKLIVALAFLFVLAFAVIFIWLDQFVKGMAMNTLRNDLLATAETAAAGINGDAHTALFESGTIDDATYTQMSSFLNRTRSAWWSARRFRLARKRRPTPLRI